MSWRGVPSLAALRAFEAAARTASFSAAARELNVTHAAVAQHVRTLEDHFGVPLMRRTGNAMTVTEEGQPLARALGEGFGQIQAAVRELAERDTERSLRVALTPSFATNWLMPRLGRFWESHPEIGIELLPGSGPVSLRGEGIDLAIRYGRGPWPGLDSEPLMPAGHVAIGATRRYPNPRSLAELRGQTWLLDSWRSEETLWAASQGVDLETERVLTFDTSQLVLEAAKAGMGVAILPRPIAAADIALGRLTELCAEGDSAVAYHLLTRPGTVRPARDTFVRWLKAEAATP